MPNVVAWHPWHCSVVLCRWGHGIRESHKGTLSIANWGELLCGPAKDLGSKKTLLVAGVDGNRGTMAFQPAIRISNVFQIEEPVDNLLTA